MNGKPFYISVLYFVFVLHCVIAEEDILSQVKEVSDDSKNNSLEFNEFLKMVALDMKSDATKNKNELLDAFRLSYEWIYPAKTKNVHEM